MKDEINLEEAKKVIDEYPTIDNYFAEYNKGGTIYKKHYNKVDASLYWFKCSRILNQSK